MPGSLLGAEADLHAPGAALEAESGIPAIAYTHASFFVAFKALGIRDTIRGHGRLLASLAEMNR